MIIEAMKIGAKFKNKELNEHIADEAEESSKMCRYYLSMTSGMAAISLLCAAGAMDPEMIKSFITLSPVNIEELRVTGLAFALTCVPSTGLAIGTGFYSKYLANYLGYRRFVPGFDSIDSSHFKSGT